jgi:uncharacterized repeat protein (TIGR02543 family)
MDREQVVQVLFRSPQFDLTVTSGGSGAGLVTSDPPGIECGATCAAPFDVNTVVELTATPAPGSVFVEWTGACTGSGACMVAMDQDRAVTATFDGITHTVTVMRVGQGTVVSMPAGINCGATCSGVFGEGQMIQLTATPAAGYGFTGWSGACAAAMSNPVCMLTVAADLNATATFEPFYLFPLAADASCTQLLHFDNPSPLAQACGGGNPAMLVGTYAQIMSRTTALGTAPNAGGADEEAYIDLAKPGPAAAEATIELTVRKAGPAFNTRGYGVLYSDQDAADAATRGVRLLITDTGELRIETRDAAGMSSTLATAAGAIADNTWYHVAATLSAANGLELFIDGAQVATTAGPLAWTQSSSTARAGAEREGAGAIYRFNGVFDEIRVSNTVRY